MYHIVRTELDNSKEKSKTFYYAVPIISQQVYATIYAYCLVVIIQHDIELDRRHMKFYN